jgi:large subunit ribosomal protein L22
MNKYTTVSAGDVRASSLGIRGSARKLSLLAALVRGLKVSDAIQQLDFSKKRLALDVKKCIISCVSNAKQNTNFVIENLFISSIYVGKGKVMKRLKPRARGRSSRILKPFSNLYVKLNIKN